MTDLIPLHRLPDLLPRRRRGVKLSYATAWRWATHGVRGHRLRIIRIGSQPCTKQEWLDEFFAACAGRHDAVPSSSTATRRREIARAEKELAEAGI